jgi:hypothetical protein
MQLSDFMERFSNILKVRLHSLLAPMFCNATATGAISEMGQKSSWPMPSSGLPLKADIRRSDWVVR